MLAGTGTLAFHTNLSVLSSGYVETCGGRERDVCVVLGSAAMEMWAGLGGIIYIQFG